jgi:hypothetical protein
LQSHSSSSCGKPALKELIAVPEADNLDNLNVMKNLVNVLISISERRTDHVHAMMTMDTLIKQLEPQFNFLKNIHIRENFHSESEEMISVMSDINAVKPTELAKAIYALIVAMYEVLGDLVSTLFIEEIKQALGYKNVYRMREIGVNFTRLQLDIEFKHLLRMFSRKKM